ncbi:nucleoside hydrolase [Microbacterium esteraromaticum]|uniref:nucleoside hydrolase n=1 Tax=Microbacterium esteraromaticum TaxID=57043 RepID=UPI001F49C921|nr:nucleoside hydrolase [Microbacterium esteraromaticum]
MPTPVILDVDTGVDDALALLFAVAHPEIEVLGVTCVAGNAGLDDVVANTLRILDLAGAADVPVAAGAARPLIAPARAAAHVHGEDGLGGIALPPATRGAADESAVAMMRRLIMQHPEPVTLVALAPQTNLALLLRTHPEVAARIERIVFMGGSASVGNATAVAEFNVWHDPEAAAIVLDAGVPTTMYGLDVFERVSVPLERAKALTAGAHRAGRAVGELLGNRVAMSEDESLQYTGLIGDAGAVCAIVAPELVRFESLPVRVELSGYSRGQTVVDRRAYTGEDSLHGLDEVWSRSEVALGIDADAVADLFLKMVLTLPE